MVAWTLPVRGVQAFCAVIVLGTAGYLVSVSDDYFANFPQADFNVFTALWTILVAVFFIVTTFVGSDSFAGNPIISLVVDGLSWIFWLSGFACMAAWLNDLPVDPSAVNGNAGGCVKATIAFGVIEWLLFTATLIWNGLSGMRGSKSGAAPGA